jgi:integrase
LRHTFATELANANVSVYTLMKLLGHESMVTSSTPEESTRDSLTLKRHNTFHG